MSRSLFVKAAYGFSNPEPGEIRLDVGDVIKVIGKVDESWQFGRNFSQSDQTGNFPTNFVEELKLPSLERGQTVFLAIESFTGEVEDDLAFCRGDLILGLKMIDSSWWKGKIQDRIGIFPLTFVTELISYSEDDYLYKEAEPDLEAVEPFSCSLTAAQGFLQSENSRFIAKGKATLDLAAQLDNELSFKKGDIIDIIRRVDDVFAVGQINSKIGQFPIAFVDIIDGCIDSLAEGPGTCQPISKFNWWKNPVVEKEILDQVVPGKAEPIPSFEEQTAPIDCEELYCLNTSHAFYSKPSDSMAEVIQTDILSEKVTVLHQDSSEDLVIAEALFKFSAENDNELEFEAGELIVVLSNIDGQWLEGKIGEKCGIFPASFVKILSDNNSENKVTGMNDKLVEDTHNLDEFLYSGDDRVRQLTIEDGHPNDVNRFHQNLEGIDSSSAEKCSKSVEKDSEVAVLTEFLASVLSPSTEVIGIGFHFGTVSKQGGCDTLPLMEAEVSTNTNKVAAFQPEEKHCSNTTQPDANTASVDVVMHIVASEVKMLNGLEAMNVVEASKLTASKLSPSNDSVCKLATILTCSPIEAENLKNSQKETDLKSDEQVQPKACPSANNIPVDDVPVDVTASDGSPETSLQPAADVTVSLGRSSSKCSSNIKSGFPSVVDMEKPLLKTKPQVKPKPDFAQLKTKSTEVTSDITVELTKRNQMKKAVSFCLDSGIVYPRDSFHEEDLDVVTKGDGGESHHKLVEELKDSISHNASNSNTHPEVSLETCKNHSNALSVSSPTSPTTDCHIDSNTVTVHFSKGSRVPLQKPCKPQPVSSKKKAVSEKEAKSEADGLKIGHSLFYGGSTSGAVDSSPKSPLSSRKVPPRPTKPKSAPSQGDTIIPNGIFYTSLLEEVNRMKPVPCRPAPPRPASVSSVSSSTTAVYMEVSEEFDSTDVENLDVMKDIERRISEIEKDLENLQREEALLLSSLPMDTTAAAAGAEDERDSVTEKVEFCRANAVGLAEELSHLKENLSHLHPSHNQSPNRPKPDEKFTRERAQMAKKRREEIRKKRRETRAQIIQEVIQTEHDYVQSILLCLETFCNPEMSEVKCPPSVELGTLFGNIYEVVELSQKFINLLESNSLGKSFEEQQVGVCFEELKEELKCVYAVYCRNHDDVTMLLEKYETIPEVQDYFSALITRMRLHRTVFDIGSILIKPVQRILKYPLLLQELHKVTEMEHADYRHLEDALKAMKDVAAYINEFKRRKDLVLKYKNPTDVSLRDLLSRMTVHSYKKKIGRISMMVTGTLTVDEKFSKEEMKFNALEEEISMILQNISQYLDFLQKSLAVMETVANDTADYYGLVRSEHEIDQFCRVSNCLLHTLFSHFKAQVQSDVLPPLNGLMTLLLGPQKLIKKRYHKLLDYENVRLKQKTVRDADQVKMMKTEVIACKSNYEALNLQLLEDLPKFYQLSISVITDCLRQFILIQEGFWLSAQREILKLLKMKGIGDHSRGIVETFNIVHTEVVDRLSDLMLIPKSFNPLIDEKRRQRRRQSQEMSSPTVSDGAFSEQLATQRDLLGQAFPPDRLYVVTEDFEGSQVMDMKLNQGTLVGLIKESDPMGNRDRFLVTDGANKGFIPRRLLNAFKSALSNEGFTQGNRSHSPSSPSSARSSSSHLSDFPVTEVLSPNEPLDAVDNDHQISVPSGEDETHCVSPFTHNEKCIPVKMLYCADYPYDAEGDFEISLSKSDLVKVLQQRDVGGNEDWWLVEREDGRQGYVPAAFLSKAQLPP